MFGYILIWNRQSAFSSLRELDYEYKYALCYVWINYFVQNNVAINFFYANDKVTDQLTRSQKTF